MHSRVEHVPGVDTAVRVNAGEVSRGGVKHVRQPLRHEDGPQLARVLQSEPRQLDVHHGLLQGDTGCVSRHQRERGEREERERGEGVRERGREGEKESSRYRYGYGK